VGRNRFWASTYRWKVVDRTTGVVEPVSWLPGRFRRISHGIPEIVAGDEGDDHHVGLIPRGMVLERLEVLRDVEAGLTEGEHLHRLTPSAEVALEDRPERPPQRHLQRLHVGVTDDRDAEGAGGLGDRVIAVTPAFTVDGVAGEPFQVVAAGVARPAENAHRANVLRRHEVGRHPGLDETQDHLGEAERDDQGASGEQDRGSRRSLEERSRPHAGSVPRTGGHGAPATGASDWYSGPGPSIVSETIRAHP
jgi:hypothetical protein